VIDFSYNGCTGLIAPGQVRSEITQLVKILKERKPVSIIEIGTYTGGSLFLFSSAAAPDAKITSVDLPQGEFGGGYPEWLAPFYGSFATEKQEVHLIRGDSHKDEILKKVKGVLGGRKVDFLFIDGDHTYKGVKRDFEACRKLVCRGGIIALHDIVVHPPETKCDVARFWEEVKKEYKTKDLVQDYNPDLPGFRHINPNAQV